MSDDKLTAAAAKAAGITAKGFSPLTDDGDALRLAVKLRKMPVIERWSDGHDWVFIPGHEGGALPLGNDPIAATRRAIVMAAAELGRSMA